MRAQYGYADEVSGRIGTSEAGTALTSTFRTAGCGPACPVVWEGVAGITGYPYPVYIQATAKSTLGPNYTPGAVQENPQATDPNAKPGIVQPIDRLD
jgi:hypothetical protein